MYYFDIPKVPSAERVFRFVALALLAFLALLITVFACTARETYTVPAGRTVHQTDLGLAT